MDTAVLVVDDDVDLHLTLIETLEAFGYRVLSAFNGLEAMELLSHLDEKPGLIVLDWMMPMMNGEQTLCALKSDEKLAMIPVVVLSAHCRWRVPRVEAVLSKPIGLEELRATIE